MRLPTFLAIVATLVISTVSSAQPSGYNYDEARVPEYELPNPLVHSDGTTVEDAKTWVEKRRPEILELLRQHVYGRAPERPENMTFEVLSSEKGALGGKAIRKQVRVYFSGEKDGPQMDILIYLPIKAGGKVPVFLGLNFRGNHSIHHDPDIPISQSWMRNEPSRGNVDHKATEASRGEAESRWPVEMILARGYALATIYYGDIDPDFDDEFQNGVHAMYYGDGKSKPAADDWGSIATWAWGLSRALDYLETDDDVNAQQVAVLGHSRLGKTALWAGASDPRFAITISNDSGCGGAALSRRRFGETVKRINTSFPHWFCDNFNKYNDNEDTLPVDQHMLVAAIAPRPAYIASAQEDRWADPHGEFLAARHADAVYRLLGTEGLPADTWPGVNRPVHGTLGYHVRTGKHDVTDYDWQQYLDFADRHFRQPEPFEVVLWPDGAPGVGKEEPREIIYRSDNRIGHRVTKVTKPILTVYKPHEELDTGAAVLVCPGGGYSVLAIDHEGVEIARWLNSIGVTGIVLQYRVPRSKTQPFHMPPLQDAQRAMRVSRQNASKWGIDANRLGILGFSAGGHLSAATSTNSHKSTYAKIDEADELSTRPDFTVLVYPAYLTQEKGGLMLAPEIHVDEKTPPAFLVHAGDDGVPATNSIAYYSELRKAKVRGELHIYPSGGHGYGMRPYEHAVTRWPDLAGRWLKNLGVLERESD